MIGLDTTAIIDLFKGDPSIKEFLLKNNEPLSSTIMNYTELIFGITHQKKEEQYYDELFEEIHNFDLTKESSKWAAHIYNSLKKKGSEIDNFDCLIAAIFLENGVNRILTRNIKHFSKIKDLKVINY